jgi:hypothetical protein
VNRRRGWACAGLFLMLAGCINSNHRTGGTDAGAQGGTGGAGGSAGITCVPDPTSGVTLCLGSTACPDAVLDPKALPGCGFKTVTPSFDLECVCNGNQLCPIGVAATCAELPQLLKKVTVAEVCSQTNCKEVGPGGPSGTGGKTSTCDPACSADCAGDPLCKQSCGC